MTTNTSPSEKLDVYQIVTNKMLEFFNNGIVPWQIHWGEAGIPMNMVSKRPYRGINTWLLLGLRYEQNLFITFDQLKKIGGSVKKGETGHVVAYAITKKKKGAATEDEDFDSPDLRYYKVFASSQCVDIPEELLTRPDQKFDDPFAACESIVKNMPGLPTIKHNGQESHYDIIKDIITMPSKRSVKSRDVYYASLFGCLLQSTAHISRLNRVYGLDEPGPVIFPMLAEALIAEMGTSYLCSYTGIQLPSLKQSAALSPDCRRTMEENSKFIVRAGTLAQRAVDFVLNRNQSSQNESKEEE